ncbi:hypothetical protein EB118_07240 [bacterium]|nr:hypothetical protein [bacterium]NDC94447.1 hypothetical protein [bacterium]NDD84020.1 hypothetical protein [bacterium]NDG29876.1 hypothetical protein [bacterium]
MADTKGLIQNYGYVPFKYFQYVVLGLQIWMIQNYKAVNDYIDSYIDTKNTNHIYAKQVLLTLPLVSMIYYDIRYSSFSLKNLGFPPQYNDALKQILNIMGSYALIQVFSSDTGFKSSILQVEMLQTHLLFIIISIGMAYSVTQNRSQSILALIMFYHFKYVIGQNKNVDKN